jgi:hypothetical protein
MHASLWYFRAVITRSTLIGGGSRGYEVQLQMNFDSARYWKSISGADQPLPPPTAFPAPVQINFALFADVRFAPESGQCAVQ